MHLKRKKITIYLVLICLAFLISLKASISYALLNIFISEENLPLELGIANTIGEQGALAVNIITDTIIWIPFLALNYYIFKKLKIIKTIIFLILSPILWIAGTYIWVLIDFFVFKNHIVELFPGSCSGTGFPFMKATCSDRGLYGFYYLTIFFWFLFIWFIKEQGISRIFYFLLKKTPSHHPKKTLSKRRSDEGW
ncbi:MAG: hypothetical protein WCV81_01575 [Microgenomates group bacterium]|jgi:hypothetical protein